MTKRNIMTENLKEEIANRNTKQQNKKVQIVKFLSNNLNFFHAFSN